LSKSGFLEEFFGTFGFFLDGMSQKLSPLLIFKYNVTVFIHIFQPTQSAEMMISFLTHISILIFQAPQWDLKEWAMLLLRKSAVHFASKLWLRSHNFNWNINVKTKFSNKKKQHMCQDKDNQNYKYSSRASQQVVKIYILIVNAQLLI
jgi:hypothetical protein